MAYTRQQAWDLLTQYNKGEFHLKHACIVADVMRWYAEQLGYGEEADFWEIVGLLHDLDFELYPDEHCIKSQQIMREHGLDERLIRATASHGYGLHFDGLPEPQHEMEKVLLNFVIFFWPELTRFFQLERHQSKQASHFHNTVRNQQRQEQYQQQTQGFRHKCAVCGRTDVTNPELQFRYCSKCAGYHCFCSDHIFNHVHFTDEQP